MGRGKPPAPALPLTERQYRLLEQESRKRRTLKQYHERIMIILRSHEGLNNSENARRSGLALNTVRSWHKRWTMIYPQLLVFEAGTDNQGVSDHELLQQMLRYLQDEPRSGSPRRITLAQEQQIVALACEKPEDYGVVVTNWSHQMLAKVAMARRIVDTISPRYVGKILKKKRVASS